MKCTTSKLANKITPPVIWQTLTTPTNARLNGVNGITHVTRALQRPQP